MVPRVVPALLLLLAFLPLPGVGAAPTDAPVHLVEDPADDVATDVAGNPQPVPTQAHPNLDLRFLTVTDDPDMFHFTVGVADLAGGSDDTADDGALITVLFQHGQRQFRIEARYEAKGGAVDGSLDYRDSDAQWNEVWSRPGAAAVDATANTYSVDVERADLADAQGAAPYPGRLLDHFVVQADNGASQGEIGATARQAGLPGDLHDRMPDTGTAPQAFATAIGVAQEGHARLSSDEPYRSSNGEATTFTYTVKAQNTGDAQDTFRLDAAKVPAGWSVALPEPLLTLEGGAQSDVAVLATVPFNHVHGAAASFVLEMSSASDPATVGRLQMGVRYLKVPQPAGHHDTLFFHSQASAQFVPFGEVAPGYDGRATMNALAEDPSDAALQLSPEHSDGTVDTGGTTTFYAWCVELDPGLQMGLDFLRPAKGHVAVPLHVTAPITSAVLQASLLLEHPAPAPADGPPGPIPCTPADRPGTPLATLNASAPADLAANADGILEGDLDVLPAADRIPYLKGQNLLLYVSVSGRAPPDFVAPGAPRLIPGGTLTLPLSEYHDDVDTALSPFASQGLLALGPRERRANPGASVDFAVSLGNDGDTEQAMRLNLTGLNAAWASLPQGPVRVPAHGTARVDAVVRVPRDAQAGDRADLLLQAFGAGNATLRGLLRFVLTVDPQAGLPDDAASLPEGSPHASPGWGIAAVVLALGGAAWRRRPASGAS